MPKCAPLAYLPCAFPVLPRCTLRTRGVCVPCFAQSSRFKADNTDVPDPGSYNISGTMGKKYGRAKPSNKPSNKPNGHYRRKANAAAIPSRTEVNGYEEDPRTGELRKAFTLQTEAGDLGPGSHNIPVSEHQRSVYNGANFGKRTSNRVMNTTRAKDGPAPGAYEPISAMKMTNYLPMKRAPTSVVGKSKRDMAPQGEAIAVPAANSYDIPSCFAPVDKQQAPAHFGSTTTRFDAAPSVQKRQVMQPGPGTYDDHEAQNAHYTIQSEPTKKPFNQSAARFSQKPNNERAPAPNGYSVESWYGGQSGVKVSVDSKLNVAARGGFGSDVPRIDPFEDKVRQKIAPAPGAYNVAGQLSGQLTSGKLLKTKNTSMFKSTTAQRPKAQHLDKPRPTEYNVRETADLVAMSLIVLLLHVP